MQIYIHLREGVIEKLKANRTSRKKENQNNCDNFLDYIFKIFKSPLYLT